MKVRNSLLTLLFVLAQMLVFTSCDEAPRDRPTFNYSKLNNAGTGTTSTDDEDETKPIPTRPDGELYIKSGFCGCHLGKPITLGNCTSFCSSKNVPDETLYVEVEPSAAITGRDDLGSFHSWCTKELVDPNTGEAVATGVGCAIHATDEDGNKGQLTITSMNPGSNKLEINMSTLEENKTYRLKVVETTSGAASKTFQVRKYEAPQTDPVSGPLWTVPVHQYTCIWRLFSTQGNSIFYEGLQRVHYYFNDETRPEPLEAGIVDIYCHDIYVYGSTPRNNPLLEETPGSFTLWSNWDPRFFEDTNPDKTTTETSKLSVNQILMRRVEEQGYNMTAAPDLFYQFKWPNGPAVTSGTNGGSGGDGAGENSEPLSIGWYMTPWIDQTTYKAYCPKQEHYYSSNQLFVAMRDVIGLDTEGLYIAKQESVEDYILIKESLLKEIWFYIEGNQHIEPNNDTVTGKQIQFYWPPDTDSPFVRKSHQQVFTVKAASEVGQDGGQQNPDGTNSIYPPHDKRLGCVPQL